MLEDGYLLVYSVFFRQVELVLLGVGAEIKVVMDSVEPVLDYHRDWFRVTIKDPAIR